MKEPKWTVQNAFERLALPVEPGDVGEKCRQRDREVDFELVCWRPARWLESSDPPAFTDADWKLVSLKRHGNPQYPYTQVRMAHQVHGLCIVYFDDDGMVLTVNYPGRDAGTDFAGRLRRWASKSELCQTAVRTGKIPDEEEEP